MREGFVGKRGNLGGAAAVCALAALVGTMACEGAAPGEPTGVTAQAVTGADAGLVTISGTVLDSSGNPVGVQVLITVTGSHQTETYASMYTGKYSISVPPGSYSISAATTGACLAFAPSVANLNNLTASTTVNFVGSGNDEITNCEPAASSGGTSGSLTLSGVVTSAGQPVAGAKVSLNGSSQGFRYTDETGAYSFQVNPGSYAVSVSEGCTSYSPSVVNLNNLAKSTTENFAGTGDCPPAPLALCPLFDTAYDLSALGDVCINDITTNNCADRIGDWAFNIILNFAPVIGTDCRFGGWDAYLSQGVQASQALLQLQNFILYFLGCPYVGTQIGPLTDGLAPQALVNDGIKFTTADLSALSQDFIVALNTALEQAGANPLTASQQAAVQTQLNYLQANFPNAVNSSSYSLSTCGDAGH